MFDEFFVPCLIMMIDFSSNNDANYFIGLANEFYGYHNIKHQHDVDEFEHLSSVDSFASNQQSFVSTVIHDELIRAVTDMFPIDVSKRFRFNKVGKCFFSSYSPRKFKSST